MLSRVRTASGGAHAPRRSAARALASARAAGATCAALVLLTGLVLTPGPARALRVSSYLTATIQILPNGQPGSGTPPIPLDLDLSNPGGGARHISIPVGSIAEFVITGIAEGGGVVALSLMDADEQEAARGWDDELETRFTPLNVPAADTFTVFLFCDCTPGSNTIESLDSSGEQTAEIYVKDGTKTIPGGPAGAGTKGWWQVDCDKTSAQPAGIVGDTVATAWRDTLVIPPGALTTTTNVHVANMYPLLAPEARPPGYLPISEALTLGPSGLALQVPARLIFSYTQEEVGDVADEATLAVFRYDPLGQAWVAVPGAQVDPVHHTLSVDISTFETYGFAAATPQLVPTSVQVVATDAGDATLGMQDLANGSELDQVAAVTRDGMLYLYFGGNLASDPSHLEIFLDTGPGGQNRLRGDNPAVDAGGLLRMGDDGSGNGLTFDPAFAADHWIGVSGAVDHGGYRLRVHHAELLTGGGGSGGFLGETGAASEGLLEGGTNPGRIGARIDNSNTAGVPAGCGPAGTPPVPTGIELAIPLVAIGAPTSCVSVCAFVNGPGHANVSNQFLAPLAAGTCSLGEPRLVNLGAQRGDQHFPVCGLSVVGVGPGGGATPHTSFAVVASPNPSRGDVALRISGAPAPGVFAEVHDLAGRRVRFLPRSAFRTGAGTWDGRDETGRRVPAGLYLVRVRGIGVERTVRVLRLD